MHEKKGISGVNSVHEARMRMNVIWFADKQSSIWDFQLVQTTCVLYNYVDD